MGKLIHENRSALMWMVGLLLSMTAVLSVLTPKATHELLGYAHLHVFMEFAAA